MNRVFESAEGVVYRPVERLTRTNKFEVGPVTDEAGKTFFAKVVGNCATNSILADLENEVRWNQTVGPQIDADVVGIPGVVTYDLRHGWVVFDYIAGEAPKEEDLGDSLLVVSGIAQAIGNVPLGRYGSDLTRWYWRRMEELNIVLDTPHFKLIDRMRVTRILSNEDLTSRLTAGIVHGDLNLKNLLVVNEGTPANYLVDAEFGTLPEKPDWDKPRFHDMAYFYHLLRCQYHRPDLAEDFWQACWSQVSKESGLTEEEFTAEFYLSVLERTVSMMKHFITRPRARKIDDKRRREPGPYVATVRHAVDALAKVS